MRTKFRTFGEHELGGMKRESTLVQTVGVQMSALFFSFEEKGVGGRGLKLLMREMWDRAERGK